MTTTYRCGFCGGDVPLESDAGHLGGACTATKGATRMEAVDYKPMTDEEIVAEARRAYETEDDIDIDESPAISRADSGAWVAAWVWVDFEEAA
jgi:hypothetical protein